MIEPTLSITMVIFSLLNDHLMIMMEKSSQKWVLPEDVLNTRMDNSLEQAAKRVFKNKMGFETPYLEQVQTIGNNHRVPQKWSVSVNYYGLVSQEHHTMIDNTQWIPYSHIADTNIAFDHRDIIESCLHRFQNKSLYTSLPIFLLPKEFTLTELQKTYEIVLGFKVEKKSFRRRLLDAGFLEETGNIRRASHRPALLYQLATLQPYFFPRIIEGSRTH